MRRVPVVLALLVLGSAAVAAAPADYLPTPANLPGWTPEGKTDTYTADTLWDLMDGGAEVYLEYGLVSAAREYYRSPVGGKVEVDIYAMKDAGAAYGIYSFNARSGGNPVAVGDDAVRTDYFVLVRKGAHFFTVTASADPAAAMPGCLDLARAIAARVPAVGERPALLSRLPALPGPKAHRVYLRGSLGVLNLYPFDATDPFEPVEGAVAESGDTQFFILRHADEREATQRGEAAWSSLSSNSKYKPGPGGSGGRCLIDERGRRLLLARDGACTLVAIGPDEAALHVLLQQVLRSPQR